MSEIGQLLGLPASCGGILCHGGTLGNLVARWLRNANWDERMALTHGKRVSGRSRTPWSRWCLSGRTIASTAPCGPWAGAMKALSASRRMRRTKCVWMHLLKALRRVTNVGSTSSPLSEVPAPQVPALTILWKTSRRFADSTAFGFMSTVPTALLRHSRRPPPSRGRDGACRLWCWTFTKLAAFPLYTGVFYADQNDSYLPFSQHAEYLWDHADEAHWWDTGKRTFECTKRMLSTRLAAVKAEYGWGIWTDLVDRMWRWGASLLLWLKNAQVGSWPCLPGQHRLLQTQATSHMRRAHVECGREGLANASPCRRLRLCRPDQI